MVPRMRSSGWRTRCCDSTRFRVRVGGVMVAMYGSLLVVSRSPRGAASHAAPRGERETETITVLRQPQQLARQPLDRQQADHGPQDDRERDAGVGAGVQVADVGGHG